MPTTKIAPFTIAFHNSEEFHVLKNEVFTQDEYYFETDNPTPFIIDAGAHIGLATLYFKKLFPGAEVLAIEANPKLIPLLEENIYQNGLLKVEVLPVALADHVGEATFFMDETTDQWWSTGSFEPGAWNHLQHSQSITVPTQSLTNLIHRPVDFLKMDIEGAEVAVITAAAEKLHFIKHMMIEFHPLPNQNLVKFVEFLEEHRFKVQVWKDGKEISEPKRAKGLVYVEAIS